MLRDGHYQQKPPGTGGIVETEQFRGLRLDIPQALAMDLAGVLKALD